MQNRVSATGKDQILLEGRRGSLHGEGRTWHEPKWMDGYTENQSDREEEEGF